MSRLNKIILIGNVSSEPKTNVTNTGDTVTNFELTVDRQPVENMPQQSDIFTIIAWRDLADTASQFSMNTSVLVEGSIRNRNFENNEGQRVYVTEIEARSLKPLQISSVNQTQDQNSSEEPILDTSPTNNSNEEVFDFNEAIKENTETTISEPDFSKEIGEDVPF